MKYGDTDLAHLCRTAQVDIAFALFLGLALYLLLRGLLG